MIGGCVKLYVDLEVSSDSADLSAQGPLRRRRGKGSDAHLQPHS
jgi:hypothetical protein